MAIETREIREGTPRKKELFPKAIDKYNELYRNNEIKEVILNFLMTSENRRLGDWRRNWREMIHGRGEEWNPGKELENVLAKVFDQGKIFGENFKIYLSSDKDDRNGKDLIIYNPEKNILLTIDLTMNNDKESINGKLIWSNQDNPTSLENPPKERKDNPKALRFTFALPNDVGYEMMNRFYEALKEKNFENLKENPLIIAIFLECLEQIEIQLNKIPEIKKSLIEREVKDFSQILSSQREELGKKLTPESKKIKEYLEESNIGKQVRKILEKI